MPANPSFSSITRMSSSLKDLFILIYDLSPLEMDLLLFLISENTPLTLDDLTKELNRDKSTVFRALQKLVNLGICTKDTKTLKEGGLYHVYSAIPKEMLLLETEKKVKELEQSLKRILKKFQDDLENMLLANNSRKK